jgi:hypothetical protein
MAEPGTSPTTAPSSKRRLSKHRLISGSDAELSSQGVTAGLIAAVLPSEKGRILIRPQH